MTQDWYGGTKPADGANQATGGGALCLIGGRGKIQWHSVVLNELSLCVEKETVCLIFFGRQRIVTRVHSFVTYGINRPTIILCGNDSCEKESLGECCSLIKRHQAASLGVVGQLPRLIQSPFIPNQLSVEPPHRFQTKALSRGQQTKKETKRIERHQGAWMLEGWQLNHYVDNAGQDYAKKCES